MRTSILLVDDHPIFLKGLNSLLEEEEDMNVVGMAGDGQTALRLIQQLSPRIVIMDITMPKVNGIEATKHIVSTFPRTKVIALSIHSEKKFVKNMLQAGAIGYIVKESVPEELVKGIRSVMNGQSYLSPSVTNFIVSQFKSNLQQKRPSRKKKIEIAQTKLIPETLPDDYVHRQRLIDQLEKNRQFPVQNITAPAGYGKSTLVSRWLTDYDWPHAWITLDKEDNDLSRFARYFIHAVESLFPTALMQSSDLINADVLPPIQVLAGRLVNELNLIEQDFILVLNDFHIIKEKKVHDLVSELLHYPSKYLHLIFVSRSDPFLPLTKLRARGQLAEIRLHDLRFTNQETAQFLNRKTMETLDNKMILAWTEKTEGWITGLRLAVLSMHHQKGFNGRFFQINKNPEYIMEYLFYEVLYSQPRQVRDYLAKTSILDRFCAPLCEALFNKADAGVEKYHMDSWKFITLLKRENMFIIKLDADNKWLRYHHLFQQLLRNQLTRYNSSEQIAVLHARAGKWLAEKGLLGEAIDHTLKSGDISAVVRIIEENRQAVLDSDQWHVLEAWLDKIPGKIKNEQLQLLLSQAWVLLLSANPTATFPIIERIEDLVDESCLESILMAEISFFRGVRYCFKGEGSKGVSSFKKAKKMLLESPFLLLKAEIQFWICMALHLDGQKETAVQLLQSGIQNTDLHERLVLSRLALGSCFINMMNGMCLQAFQESMRLNDIRTSSHLSVIDSWFLYVQANSSFQMSNLDTARHLFSQIIENRQITNSRMMIDAMVGLAISNQFIGNLNEADKTIQAAQEYAKWTKSPQNLEIVDSGQARIAILRGDFKLAQNWLKSAGSIRDDQFMLFFLEIPAITECRIVLAGNTGNELEKIVSKLADLRQKFNSIHNTYQEMEIVAMQALASYRLDRLDDAFKFLKEVLVLAAQGCWIRIFIELGSPMKKMLEQWSTENTTTDFIDRILAAYNMNGPSKSFETKSSEINLLSSAASSPLNGLMTNRETEILQLLAQHLYNREIAEKLYISPETVKTHLKKIYEKLEVKNRREAISKANQEGLVVSAGVESL